MYRWVNSLSHYQIFTLLANTFIAMKQKAKLIFCIATLLLLAFHIL
jgi:hypothetical protein